MKNAILFLKRISHDIDENNTPVNIKVAHGFFKNIRTANHIQKVQVQQFMPQNLPR
jgi:hypothetical protein